MGSDGEECQVGEHIQKEEQGHIHICILLAIYNIEYILEDQIFNAIFQGGWIH